MNDLTDPAGIAALAAGGVALIALILAIALAVKLRRLRSAQQVVLGGYGRQDLVAHASGLQSAFEVLHGRVEEVAQQLDERMADAERNGVVLSCIAHRDNARLYSKVVRDGRGEHELSPEEDEAIRLALAGEPSRTVTLD